MDSLREQLEASIAAGHAVEERIREFDAQLEEDQREARRVAALWAKREAVLEGHERRISELELVAERALRWSPVLTPADLSLVRGAASGAIGSYGIGFLGRRLPEGVPAGRYRFRLNFEDLERRITRTLCPILARPLLRGITLTLEELGLGEGGAAHWRLYFRPAAGGQSSYAEPRPLGELIDEVARETLWRASGGFDTRTDPPARREERFWSKLLTRIDTFSGALPPSLPDTLAAPPNLEVPEHHPKAQGWEFRRWKEPWEGLYRRHARGEALLIGYEPESGDALLLKRKALHAHAHVGGGTSAGKTSGVISPLVTPAPSRVRRRRRWTGCPHAHC